MANYIPDGMNSVGCYLVVPNAVEALDFYARAFGATPLMRMEGFAGPDSTMHAEMTIGDSTVMLTDENPEWGMQGAKALGGSPVSLHMYVEDCDALFNRAVAAGCEVAQPLMDMFWGDRYGKVTDPYGLSWGIATHKEDVPPEEMMQRAEEWKAQMAAGGGEASES